MLKSALLSARELLQHLEAAEEGVTLPCQADIRPSEALSRLRLLLGDKEFITIDMQVKSYHGQAGIAWSVFDGDKSYSGKTLSDAVNACLAAHAKPPADPLAVADAVAEQLVPMPF